MGLRSYRLSEPPSWPLRALGAGILAMTVTTWFVLPTTLAGQTAPLVPALVLEAAFLGTVGVGLQTTPGELQDGIIVVVASGAVAVVGLVLAQYAVGGDVTHPINRVLLSLTVGVGAGLVATVPAFGFHVFGESSERRPRVE